MINLSNAYCNLKAKSFTMVKRLYFLSNKPGGASREIESYPQKSGTGRLRNKEEDWKHNSQEISVE